ncbi:MAG: IS110 family transposase, partial [Sedimentisphaerales bacterium]|nr:IS110 family transposase [Sedimentisphaerales bacterium]
MRKHLYGGVDLHSNDAMYVITDEKDKQRFCRRLPNELPVVLAHPSEMDQYDGIKEADDLTAAAFLARLARLNILPTGYIYPKQDRPVRDRLRRRTLVVQQRTGIILSLQNMAQRQTGRRLGGRALRQLSDQERAELLGDHDCLGFVTDEQVDLIELLTEKIRRFEKKGLEPAQLRPAYARLLTLPGVGMILALTIMLETGDIGRFQRVGDYSSYCRCLRARHLSNGKKKTHNNGKNGNPYLAWA